MNNSKDIIIDKYTQPIFPPYDLYVLKNPTNEYIINTFEWDDGVEIKEEDLKIGKGITFSMACKKDDKQHSLCIFICLYPQYFDKEDKLDHITVCSHEASHVVFRILNYCGIQLTEDTTETYAFMQGWITKCIYNTYKKKTNE